MARFLPVVDIWALDPVARGALQPGQWVTAGPDGPKGRFLGQTRNAGSEVVAWSDNARGRPGYVASLRAYAKGAA